MGVANWPPQWSEPCLTAWPGDSRIPPPEGSRDPRFSKEQRPPWTASQRWSEGETAKVDFNSYLAVTLAHLDQERVRVKRAANPGLYAEQLPRVLGCVFPRTARRRSGGGKPQQEKAARE